MSLFLDISLLIIIVATVLSCWFKGFVRSVFGLAKSLLCMVMAYLFGPMVSSWIAERWIDGRVTQFVYDRLLSMFDAGAESFDLTQVQIKLPSWLNFILEKMGLNVTTLAGDLANQTEADADGLWQLSSTLARPVANLFSNLIGYAIVFLIAMLLFSVIAGVLIKIANLPVLRKIDRALGLVLGIGCALIYTAVYTFLMYAVMNLAEASLDQFSFQEAFEKTILFKYCFNYNIFRWIFGIGL